MRHPRKKRDAKRVFATILFASLVLAALFTVFRLITAPSASEAEGLEPQRADYTLMLLQCLLAIVVMMVPSIIERRWQVPIPSLIYILFYVFLYCAVFLGEVLSFYYRVPHWDTILHAFSGAALGALGFILVTMLNSAPNVLVRLSPFFVALFAFCFALAMGAVWEIYEFAIDGLMGLNMQKYLTAEGAAVVGRGALLDTMKDILSDALSALAVAIVGYVNLKDEGRKAEPPAQEGGVEA